MYVQTAGGFNKILGQIVAFTRSGSLLVSGLTAGIKTRKENVQLLGPHAQTVVDGTPMFYFIPPSQARDAGVNAGDLVLMRLEEKAKRRQFEVAAQGAWRGSAGISITHQIQILRSEVKPGIYAISPVPALGKGEYALYLLRGEGMQAYVYDFSVGSTCCALSDRLVKDEPVSGDQSSHIADSRGGGLGNVATTPRVARSGEVTAEISSDPLGADIEIDGSFVGSTPSSVGVVAGEHSLRISKDGYKRWERTLKSSTGNIRIAAVLEPMAANAAGTSRTPAEVAPTSTIGDAHSPANSSEGIAEEARIGIRLTGNPTARHDGVEISGVQPNGPADGIGIKSGDVILAIDDHYLFTIAELRSALSQHDPGARLTIRYRRDRLISENYLTLGSKDAVPRQ